MNSKAKTRNILVLVFYIGHLIMLIFKVYSKELKIQ